MDKIGTDCVAMWLKELQGFRGIGLTPTQLFQVDKLYGELAKENWELKRELEEYRQADDRLGVLSVTEFVDVTIKYMGEKEIGDIGKYRLLTNEHVDKWEEYKRLEQRGRLLRLPCKPGDILYWISDQDSECDYNPIEEVEACTVDYNGSSIQIWFADQKGKYYPALPSVAIGEELFYTREAAEAALAEMEGYRWE